jgi:hypothetical protein
MTKLLECISTESSTCVNNLYFDNESNEIGLQFASSDEVYFYTVNGDYNQIKTEMLEQNTAAESGDTTVSIGRYVNRLRKDNVLEPIS